MMGTKPPEDYEYNDKLSYMAEWYIYECQYAKKFILNYFPCDNTFELYDLNQKNYFLKRYKVPGLSYKDLFLGNCLMIYGRMIKILDYADCHTKDLIGPTLDHTFAIIKPGLFDKVGEIITEILEKDFMIIRLRMCTLSRKAALDFYVAEKGNPFLPFMIEHIISGPVIGLELVGNDAVNRWLKVLGPPDPIEARKVAPDTLRAKYGIERASNGFHGSLRPETAVSEACFFFPEGIDRKPPQSTARFENSTCCVIKPHAIKEGNLGFILDYILKGHFKITAMQMFVLNSANADEFLEAYKGVVSDYNAFLMSFQEGPCVALEIIGENEDMKVQEEFRKFCGPTDSEVARQIRPMSLRARFGFDKYKNAVHCTDLEEDTILELEFFFRILDS